MSSSENTKKLFKIYLSQQRELYGDLFFSSKAPLAESETSGNIEEDPGKQGRSNTGKADGADSTPEFPLFIGGDNPELRSYYHEIKNCMECGLGSTRTNFVFGVGNPNSDIMFVGEAPGRDEDAQGIPFVGRAGKLLDKLLSDIGLDRSKIYIANILKCRPPSNRDPNPMEAASCLPYLQRQIEMIEPKILVTLGRIAAQTLLETDTPIGKMRGQTFLYKGIDLVVIYHPAYLLRNGSGIEPTIQDLKRVLQLYKEKI